MTTYKTTETVTEATETVYKATAEGLKLALRSARGVRELADEQSRATRELVRKTLPREVLPYFEAGERFVDLQVETADRFLGNVTSQVEKLVTTPPTAGNEEVTKLVQAQVKLAADQYETLSRLARTQYESVVNTDRKSVV